MNAVGPHVCYIVWVARRTKHLYIFPFQLEKKLGSLSVEICFLLWIFSAVGPCLDVVVCCFVLCCIVLYSAFSFVRFRCVKFRRPTPRESTLPQEQCYPLKIFFKKNFLSVCGLASPMIMVFFLQEITTDNSLVAQSSFMCVAHVNANTLSSQNRKIHVERDSCRLGANSSLSSHPERLAPRSPLEVQGMGNKLCVQTGIKPKTSHFIEGWGNLKTTRPSMSKVAELKKKKKISADFYAWCILNFLYHKDVCCKRYVHIYL